MSENAWRWWQVPSRDPPRCGIAWNAYQTLATRAATSPRAGCVRRGLGTPLWKAGSILAAAYDPRSTILTWTSPKHYTITILMASFILMPFMLVFHQSKSINAIKRTLFYYCYTYIFIFFHVIMCSLSLRCILPRLRVEVKTKSNTIL